MCQKVGVNLYFESENTDIMGGVKIRILLVGCGHHLRDTFNPYTCKPGVLFMGQRQTK